MAIPIMKIFAAEVWVAVRCGRRERVVIIIVASDMKDDNARRNGRL